MSAIRLKKITIVILIALMFTVVLLPFMSQDFKSCDKAKCPSCFTTGSTNYSVVLILQELLYKGHRLTLYGGYHIDNIPFKSELIAFKIEHPPRVNLYTY